jgi:hypothetical protein
MFIIVISTLLIPTSRFIESCFQIFVELGASARAVCGLFTNRTWACGIHLQKLKEKFCAETPTTAKEAAGVFRSFFGLFFHLNMYIKDS